MPRIKTALVSLSDKSGIETFARALIQRGVTLISSGGTARALRDKGIRVREVGDVTGSPEMMGGRVKTLHPKIHGGILARRDRPEDIEEARRYAIDLIDCVVANLYPFAETVRRPEVSVAEILEQIDIGGPALVRAAAKNYPWVTVIVDPSDYNGVVDELGRGDGVISVETNRRLAAKAFAHVAGYDAMISNWFEAGGRLPDHLTLPLEKIGDLRYGENPHQAGAWYRVVGREGPGWADATIHQGKALSYNNLLDADAAWGCLGEFEEAACAIVKHNTPCGVSLGRTLHEAFIAARETDPTSAFGGVIALNRVLDPATAREIVVDFYEVVLAPAMEQEALGVLASKKNLRVLSVPAGLATVDPYDYRRISGSVLLQNRDVSSDDFRMGRVVSKRAPTPSEREALDFAWKVAKHVKSNAIVLAKGPTTVGIGAGQMSRVDAVRIAVQKMQERQAQRAVEGEAPSGFARGGQQAEASLRRAAKPGGFAEYDDASPSNRLVMASDAFFPFRDGIDEAAKAGVRAVVQPGGSVRDPEVIAAADEQGMAMVFTGVRHFRH